jgi:N-acetyl-gamma-glutamylphosphate reductase
MDTACRICVILCLSASLCAFAQPRDSVRTIVLPNPELIHCHAAECSQLWKQVAGNTEAVYPSQVLTDLVNGEIVGLTAVYDKSVSTNELRDAVNKLYGKWSLVKLQNDKAGLWRVEADQLAISLYAGADGANEIIYLKFGTYGSHVPSAHIDPCKKYKK